MKNLRTPAERMGEIGKTIRKKRLEKKMTVQELSKLVGTSTATISRLENAIGVKSDVVVKVMYVLDITAYLPFTSLEKKLCDEIFKLPKEDQVLILIYYKA